MLSTDATGATLCGYPSMHPVSGMEAMHTTTVTLGAPAQVNEGGQITYSAIVR